MLYLPGSLFYQSTVVFAHSFQSVFQGEDTFSSFLSFSMSYFRHLVYWLKSGVEEIPQVLFYTLPYVL